MPPKQALSLQERIDFLREVSLFSDLRVDATAMQAIAEIMTEKTFQQNEVLLTEGATGSELFFLYRGRVSISKNTAQGDEYKLGLLEASQHPFFGEGAILDSEPRSASIRADQDCHCLVLTREAFETFGKKHPDWAFPLLVRISRAVMVRLRKTNQDMLLLYHALVQEIRG